MKRFIGNLILFTVMCVIGFSVSYFLFAKRQTPQLVHPESTSSESATIAPTFSLETAPKQSLQGTIMSMTGHVEWTSRIATAPAQLKEDTHIQQGESVETKKDGSIKISLSTDLQVTLFSNSKVQFIQTLPETIVFQQDSGSVTYSKTAGNPMSVRTFGLSTEMTDGRILITMDTDQLTAVVKIQKGNATCAYNDLEYQSHVATYPVGTILVYDSEKRKLTEE
jgi:hypothetical protein